MRQFAGFLFWTAWSAAAERPGDTVSYTHNWPYDPQIGNRPTGESVIWTGVSIIMLLAGICAMVWWYAAQKAAEPQGPIPPTDPLGAWAATPSQRATLKYFFVVSALILVQILLGMITAHYGVCAVHSRLRIAAAIFNPELPLPAASPRDSQFAPGGPGRK